jgi:hypothetical protein
MQAILWMPNIVKFYGTPGLQQSKAQLIWQLEMLRSCQPYPLLLKLAVVSAHMTSLGLP